VGIGALQAEGVLRHAHRFCRRKRPRDGGEWSGENLETKERSMRQFEAELGRSGRLVKIARVG